MTTCTNCGAEMKDGAATCDRCTAFAQLAKQRKINRGLRGGAIGLALGLLVVTLLLVADVAVNNYGAAAAIFPLITFVAGLVIGLRQQDQ